MFLDGHMVRTEDGRLFWARPTPQDQARGHYLCELCGDAMTDDVLPAEQSPTGQDIACCAQCIPATEG